MVKIISDSTCDLTEELIKKYNIEILPLHIILGEEEYLDGVNIHPDEIYKWSDENKQTPKTSAAAIEDAVDIMKPYIEQGDEVVFFTISAQMSTTNNVIRLAAEEMEAEDRVFVVDSANLSTGIGLMVIEAAILSAEGKSGQEIVTFIEEIKPKVRSSFVVDTLTYLHRGGRCSGLAALAGGALKLHPKILVEDGKMLPGKKYRGKMPVVIMEYAKELESDLQVARKSRVFITHSGCDEAIIDNVRNYLEELKLFDEILVTRAGSVISSHCGYGTLGILYILE